MDRVARRVEETFPQLRDDVTNSLLLFDQVQKDSGPGQISERLIFAQIRKTVGEVSSIQPGQVVSFRGALRHLRIFLPLLIGVLHCACPGPSASGSISGPDPSPFFKSALYGRPSLSLDPKGSIVLRGTPVVIRAQATGYLPDRLALNIWPEGGEPRHVPMEPEGEGRFSYRIASAQSSFRYQAIHGSTLSPHLQPSGGGSP